MRFRKWLIQQWNQDPQKIIIACLFISLAVCLAIAFLWKESIFINSQINYQKINSYFSILGVFGVLMTFYLLYRQTNYIYRQTQIQQDNLKASNKPDLFLEEKVYKMVEQLKSETKEGLPIVYPEHFNKYDSLVVMQENDNMKIQNIGIGNAKNIIAEWRYKEEEVNKLINGIYQVAFLDKDSLQTIDFILSNSRFNLYPPYHYLLCYGEKIDKKKARPKLMLYLEYDDTLENRYNKFFEINISSSGNIVNMVPKQVIKRK